MSSRFEPPVLADDGLPVLEIGPWALDKYRLVSLYAGLFATSMRAKWDNRVYIDLFAGPGRSSVRGSTEVIASSPTLALNLKHPFDHYVFCESVPENAEALETRIRRDFTPTRATVLCGDANDLVSDVIAAIPSPSASSTVLSFCFLDPFRVSGLKFSTIETLRQRLYIDFLILIPTGMDASRNWKNDFEGRSSAIDEFLGCTDWRERWTKALAAGDSFDSFMTTVFCERMEDIGCSHGGVDGSVIIRNPDKNQRLYRLGFYSAHPLGAKFWKEARKASSQQGELF